MLREQPASPLSSAAAPPAIASLRERRPWWAKLLGRLLQPWITLRIEPQAPQRFIDQRPVCYVLEDYGLSNALILDRACRENGMPSPLRPLPGDPLGRKRAYVALSRRSAGNALSALAAGKPAPAKTHSESLARLLEAHREDPALDVQLVPVSIFVGQAPDRNSGWFSVLFSENWALVGRFRRLLAILLNGRNTLVQFAAPVDLQGIVAEGLPPERTVRKLSRVLRTHFNRIREAVIGPDLSTRRLLVDKVLASEPVKDAIADQARRDKTTAADAWKKAHAFAYEIAADYSHPVVRSASFMLTTVWNRIYRGVLVHHLDRFKAVAPGHEIVYVPSHRSHMDYLLLSYLLYDRGIVPPHIVAGINLNLPVIGSVLRKGGAFFIRRSIRGSALYSAVLSEYVAQLVAGGYSIEYFIEGGRSRTGRLLQPKGGMISMTVRAFLRQPTRPVLFQPVYIGYEKLMEGSSYLDELQRQAEGKGIDLGAAVGHPEGAAPELRPGGGELRRADRARRRARRARAGLERPAAAGRGKAGVAVEHRRRPSRSDPGQHQPRRRRQSDQPAGAGAAVDAEARDGRRRPARADRAVEDAAAGRAVQRPGHGDPACARARSSPTARRSASCIAPRTRSATCSASTTTAPRCCSATSATTCCTCSPPRRGSPAASSTTGAWRATTCCSIGRTVYPFLQGELFLPWDEDGFAERIDRTIEVFIREGLLRAGQRRRRRHPRAQRRADPTRCSACARSAIRCSRRSSATTSRFRCWPRTAPARSAPANWKACASSPRSA